MRRRFLEWLGGVDPRLRRALRGILPGHGDDPAPSPAAEGGLLLGAAVLLLLAAAALALRGAERLSWPWGGAFVGLSGAAGYLLRSSPRRPFGFLPVLLALAGGLAIAPGAAVPWLGVAAPLALLAHGLLGGFAQRVHRERSRSEGLEAAVEAQILDERSHDVTRLSTAMVRVLQTTHDATSTLSTALINAELLRKASEARSRGERASLDEEETAEDLARQLMRLRELVEEARAVGHSGAEPVESLEPVVAGPVVEEVVRSHAVRFPGVRFEASGCGSDAAVIVSGGARSLQRLLANLVENACQGDGRAFAGRVEVGVEAAPTVGSVAIRVADDGPGFAAAQLESPVAGFQTTKAEGTGLGLYTVERLARASGGSVSRENGLCGGAVVTVFLKAEERAE